MRALEADKEAAVLAIIEALRSYFVAHRDDGLSREELAGRWYHEQLLRPSQADVDRALRFMEKTRNGHARMSPVVRRDGGG